MHLLVERKELIISINITLAEMHSSLDGTQLPIKAISSNRQADE